jgi:hypothetical protein
MSSPEDRPDLVEQDMSPDGKWVPRLNAFMTWEPADGDDTIEPRGPLMPQVHDTGMYAPSAGNAMKWVPKDPPPPEAEPSIDIVAGDEDQSDAVVLEAE